MTGRALVFSDPTIIQLASERFIPVAENVSGMQVQDDAKGRFFRGVAHQGHVAQRMADQPGELVSHQGSYCFAPDGAFLASCNSLDPREMERMMREGLARWEALHSDRTREPATAGDAAPRHDSFPADVQVLHVAARDLPRDVEPPDGDPRYQRAWNYDFAWITSSEVRAMVPAPRAVGARTHAPWPVVRRLARFHLRDIVRGEPFIWPENAIERAELSSEIVAVDGRRIQLRFSGAARLSWHVEFTRFRSDEFFSLPSGYDCVLQGEATWDDERGAFAAFDLLATGSRWGSHKFNGRLNDLGPAPLGIAFGLAGDSPWERTPPHVVRPWQAHDDKAVRYAVGGDDYFGGSIAHAQ
ncbi:MAG: hypothetical protein ACRDJH_26675 [Thermomicrobiales bacterium]